MRLFSRRNCAATLACAGLWLAAGSAMADVVIIGGMGNFDVPNHEGGDCNEFEIELEGPHPEDVYHTYHNPNYGPPTITALPGNIGIRVVYNTPQHATHPNTIEHFGVSLSGAHPTTAQRFRWILGSVVNPNDPPPLPPPAPAAAARAAEHHGRVDHPARREEDHP